MTKEEKENTEIKKTRSGVSRREFITGTVGGVVVGAVVGAAAGSIGFPKTITQTTTQTATQTTTSVTTAQPWLPAKWDYAADVVVVGFGGAGAVAAIQAHNQGANVLILEKMTSDLAGGNTSVAGGSIFTPTPVSDAVLYLNAMSEGFTIPQDMVQTWANQMSQNATWLTSIGAKPVCVDNSACTPTGYSVAPNFAPEWPELPGSNCAHVFREGGPPGNGSAHYAFLLSVVQKLGISVMYSTPATDLIQNPQTKEILGVVATSKGSTINVKASKAVILTLGGFENNQQMLRDYLQLQDAGGSGTPANTGDGIVMAKKVGAALWHMDNMAGPSLAMHPDPTLPWFGVSHSTNNFIYIGSDGYRFVNESITTRHSKILANYLVNPTPTASSRWVPFPTPLPAYMVFDETLRKAGPISSPTGSGWNGRADGLHHTYTWSTDNTTELAKGWIMQGATIQALAPLINQDPTQLANVVTQYNGYCQTGVDLQFGRPKSTLSPISTPPFYAVKLSASMLNTQGGAKRNTKAQIVDENNNPILRLYSSGEFGAIYSWSYNGGGNLGESVAFGVIAGTNAAAETPWS